MTTPTAALSVPGVREPLERLRKLPRWLAVAVDAERVAASLIRHVPELRDGATRLVECEPERVRLKGDAWKVRYRLTLRGSAGQERPVILAGSLEPPGSAALPMETDAVEFDAPGWHCHLPELGLRLRNEPTDEALPALTRLTDPSEACLLLERAIGAKAYPGIRIRSCRPEVLRYKPGSRCTVRYRLDYADAGAAAAAGWPDTVVAKTHAGEKGHNAYGGMRALWGTELADGAVVTVAEPLAYLPDLRVLIQGPVPEECTLKQAVRDAVGSGDARDLDRLCEQLRRTADGLVALHRCDVRYGRTVTWWDELAEVREVISRLSVTIPTIVQAVDPLLARAQELAGEVAPDPAVPAHHDFRPAQVLLADTRIGFIDFDGFCAAEPALDLGRFRAKLRDIGISSAGAFDERGRVVPARLATLDRLCEVFLGRYQEQAPVSTGRVLLWETLDLLTAVLHTWTKVRLARVQPRLALLEHHLATMTHPTAA